tara:strand:- start:247 stop:690 length:444 start_codon:yes stop_codon:yes gene_type:complete
MTDDIASRLGAVLGACFNRGTVSEEVIAEAEAKLGLLFPPSYRIFLSHFGASFGDGIEVYGLDPSLKPGEMPQWSDVVESTLLLRPDSLPKNSIEISHDGAEFGYFLRCSKTDPGFEGPVIEWGPAHDGGKVVFASFLESVEARFCS